MYLSETHIYHLGDVEIDLSRNCMVRDGKEIHLRQKALNVLVYLLEHRERLVSKSELFDAVWKNTAVTDDALVQCITEIRRTIGDDPHNPRFIKTVPKSGYRFIGEVKNKVGSYDALNESSIESGNGVRQSNGHSKITTPDTNGTVPGGIQRPNIFRFYQLTAVTVSIFVLSAFIYFGWRSGSADADVRLPQIEGRKSIAVMFFDNQTDNPEFEWLSAGLADMLITGLSRSNKLTVLSRGQLSTLVERRDANNNSLENAKEIAHQAQAEYIVTGSFAQIGDRLRLDAQLRNAETGNLETTETLLVEKAEHILSEIDLLSLKIASRLNASPTENQNLSSVMTDNLEAYRYYSIAVEKAQAMHNKDAIELLEKAVALDPEFAMAHARIGYAYTVTSGLPEKGKKYLERAFQLSTRLTEKDRMNIAAWYSIANLDFPAAINSYSEIINRFPLETEAYWRLGLLFAGEEMFDDALVVLRQGLTVDGQAKELYNALGNVLSTQGKHNEAIAAHERYVALAPNEPNAYDSLGLSFQWSGNYEKAIENYERAHQLNPKFEIAIVHLANTRLRLGQYRQAIEDFRRYSDTGPSINEKARGFDGIAFTYMKMGDLASSAKYAEMAVKLRKESVWNSYRISVVRGDLTKATQFEKIILANIPQSSRGSRVSRRFGTYYRGMIALEKGRNDEAIELFRETISHTPTVWNDQDFEDCLGTAYLKLGRYDEAISEFERILQFSPNYPLAYYWLGKAYQAKGYVDQARDAYRTFLERWKYADQDVPEIIAAQKFLEL